MDKRYECTCVYLWSPERLFVSTCTCGCVCMCSPGRDEGRTWFIALRSIKAESPIKMYDRPIKIQTGPKPVVGKPRFRLGTRQNVFTGSNGDVLFCTVLPVSIYKFSEAKTREIPKEQNQILSIFFFHESRRFKIQGH